jgi:hypothetical protein
MEPEVSLTCSQCENGITFFLLRRESIHVIVYTLSKRSGKQPRKQFNETDFLDVSL